MLHYRVFVVMGVRVTRRFSQSRDDGEDDVDASTEKNPPGSQHDIEQGSGSRCVLTRS